MGSANLNDLGGQGDILSTTPLFPRFSRVPSYKKRYCAAKLRDSKSRDGANRLFLPHSELLLLLFPGQREQE
jgi:hypothetical protein